MKIYEKSVSETNGKKVCMVNDAESGEDFIYAPQKLGFKGKNDGENVLAPLNHETAETLRSLFPFTAPVRVLGRDRSFGVGDRLGIAAPGHIAVFQKYDAYPVLAQQSIRELNLTNRTYEDVLDCVTFAVFREGYKKGFGADGDHLKTPEDIEYALSLGFTMITLDCSEHIKNGVTDESVKNFEIPVCYKEKYLGKVFDIGEGETVAFTETELAKILVIYGEAVDFAKEMYFRFWRDGKYNADFEISIDETETPTTPHQHFFVANELSEAGVEIATMAPRFCGEFQKGIDYIGDLNLFEAEMKVHAQLARHFGYKLSIHSGSDKFSTFPVICRETRGRFHVKTAGTNWLEAMRVVAECDPALYREVHKYALSAFSEATKYYHVTTVLSNIPCIDSLSDSELPALFEQNDARQLIHITYGLILNKKRADGIYEFKDRLYKLWEEHSEEYKAALMRHIGRHLELLGVREM